MNQTPQLTGTDHYLMLFEELRRENGVEQGDGQYIDGMLYQWHAYIKHPDTFDDMARQSLFNRIAVGVANTHLPLASALGQTDGDGMRRIVAPAAIAGGAALALIGALLAYERRKSRVWADAMPTRSAPRGFALRGALRVPSA
jgi:hypothetical protein